MISLSRLSAVVITTAALSTLTTVAYAQAPSKMMFVQKATVSNLFEIQTSQLALQRSQSNDVKAFAQQMVTDHTKAGMDMQAALAKDTAETAPPMTLDPAHQAKLEQLRRSSPESFDRAYVMLQNDAHHDAVGLFQLYAQGGEPGPLKDFAATTLPVLQMHLQHVQMLTEMKP